MSIIRSRPNHNFKQKTSTFNIHRSRSEVKRLLSSAVAIYLLANKLPSRTQLSNIKQTSNMLQESISSYPAPGSLKSVLSSLKEPPKSLLYSFLEMLLNKASTKTNYPKVLDEKNHTTKPVPNLTSTFQTATQAPKRQLSTPPSQSPVLFASLQPITPRPEFQAPSVIRYLALLERRRINKLQRQKTGRVHPITPSLSSDELWMRKEVWDEGKSYGAGIDDGDEEDDEDIFLSISCTKQISILTFALQYISLQQ
jgi:hypothetical protein